MMWKLCLLVQKYGGEGSSSSFDHSSTVSSFRSLSLSRDVACTTSRRRCHKSVISSNGGGGNVVHGGHWHPTLL